MKLHRVKYTVWHHHFHYKLLCTWSLISLGSLLLMFRLKFDHISKKQNSDTLTEMIKVKWRRTK